MNRTNFGRDFSRLQRSPGVRGERLSESATEIIAVFPYPAECREFSLNLGGNTDVIFALSKKDAWGVFISWESFLVVDDIKDIPCEGAESFFIARRFFEHEENQRKQIAG